MKFKFLIFVLILPVFANAKTLKNALEKYSKATTIQFDIKKIDEKITLGSKSESQGVLKFQKNNIYILQKGEKKVEIFYVNNTLSMVEYPDADFGPDGKRKVTILKNSVPPLIKSLCSIFSTPKNFSKEFLTVSEKKADGLLIVELKPKQKNINNIFLKINENDLSLVELSFADDLQTKTTIFFSNLKLNTKMSKVDFQYKSIMTDEVLTQ